MRRQQAVILKHQVGIALQHPATPVIFNLDSFSPESLWGKKRAFLFDVTTPKILSDFSFYLFIFSTLPQFFSSALLYWVAAVLRVWVWDPF